MVIWGSCLSVASQIVEESRAFLEETDSRNDKREKWGSIWTKRRTKPYAIDFTGNNISPT